MRDQLWAEAVHLFKADRPWWLETPELEALATAEQAARFARDPWEEIISDWLGDRTDVTFWDVLNAIGLNSKQQQDRHVQRRIVSILTSLGFRRRRPRTPEGREYRYQRDPSPERRMTD